MAYTKKDCEFYFELLMIKSLCSNTTHKDKLCNGICDEFKVKKNKEKSKMQG